MGLRLFAIDRRRFVHFLSWPRGKRPLNGATQKDREDNLGNAGPANPEACAQRWLPWRGAKGNRGFLRQPNRREHGIDHGLSSTDLRIRSEDRQGIVAMRRSQ